MGAALPVQKMMEKLESQFIRTWRLKPGFCTQSCHLSLPGAEDHTRVCRQKTLDVTLSELGAHVRSPPGDMRRVQREQCAGLFAQGELEQPTKEALESTAEDQSPIPALPHCT